MVTLEDPVWISTPPGYVARTLAVALEVYPHRRKAEPDGTMRARTMPVATKWHGGYRLCRAMPGPRASETKRRGEILNGDRTSTFKLEIPARLNVRHRENAGYATVSRSG